MKIVLSLLVVACIALFQISSPHPTFHRSEHKELASVPKGIYQVFAFDKDRQGNIIHITLDASKETGTALMLGFDCSPELGEKIVKAKKIEIK